MLRWLDGFPPGRPGARRLLRDGAARGRRLPRSRGAIACWPGDREVASSWPGPTSAAFGTSRSNYRKNLPRSEVFAASWTSARLLEVETPRGRISDATIRMCLLRRACWGRLLGLMVLALDVVAFDVAVWLRLRWLRLRLQRFWMWFSSTDNISYVILASGPNVGVILASRPTSLALA